ncbi:MAG: Calx-beta domain-containing protein [Candidatus Promineifilaceae bacterium]|nr:Calx-beta domain-containing protein [Candidatus Promineifilaceae bacterium]
MNTSSSRRTRPAYLLFVVGLAILPLVLILAYVSTVYGGTPLNPGPGYQDYSYADPDFDVKDPTGEKPESKLWWNDGYWWGSMYVPATNSFHIHRLQWGTQTWVDTGVKLDDLRDPLDREMTKADTLWDEANQKLYVASHAFKKNSTPADEKNYARLFRYSYIEATQTYSLDAEFQGPPFVAINQDKTETITIDKDSTGRLWTTYVSRPTSAPGGFQVYVNTSAGGGLANDSSWGTPFGLPAPVPVTATQVVTDDVSTLVALPGKIGVVWTNQSAAISNTVHIALHSDGSNPTTGWQYIPYTLPAGVQIDDHLAIKSIAVNPNGQMFVAMKLKGANPTDPGIGVVAMDTDGTISFHEYSKDSENDTRPILVIDETANLLYVFVSGKDGGSKICYKTLAIPGPGNLDTMGDFPTGDCGADFIEDDILKDVNNATSQKRNVNATTGIVILAADDKNGKYYVHNTIGDPPPVVDATYPERDMIGVPLTATVKATFSKDMNEATINQTSFLVTGPSGQLAGSVTYNAALKTATFTPDQPFDPNATYTVELTQAIQDASGNALNQGIDVGNIRESWQFKSEGPKVHFSSAGYTVDEGMQATITVALESASSEQVMVSYETMTLSPGELPPGTTAAVPGVDYTSTSNTLTFAPGVTEQTFNVATIPNAVIDGQKALGLKLSNPSGSSLGIPSMAILTIFDDETPTVRFQNSEYTVNEGDGTATIGLTLSPVSGTAVSVDFSTQDGTATAGEDYTAVTNQPVTFAPGETSKNVTVNIINDNLNELNETVSLILNNPNPGNTVIANSPATLVIIDNDPQPQVRFKTDKYTVNENANKVIIDVELSAISGREVTVKYETGSGSATPGMDYTPAMGTLTFPKGQTVQSFEVQILDDSDSDANETFNVGLSDPDGATIGVPPTAQVTIIDGDSPGIFLPVVIGNIN